MVSKQLSVFIENRQGRLGEVLNVLKQNNVDIISLSIADTTEYGLLRLMVDNPSMGKEKLSEKGFSAMLTDVFVIFIDNVPGSLQGLLEFFDKNNLNIEYMYGLSIQGKNASIVLKASDMKLAGELLKQFGVETLILN